LSRSEQAIYDRFVPSLKAAYEKIDEYYEKTTDTPAYIVAMILDPRQKMGYFKKHWSAELQVDVIKCVEEVFKERYVLLRGQSTSRPVAQHKKKLSSLLRELSDDEDATDAGPAAPEDPTRPWLRDFRVYLDVVEHVPEGWTTIQWWGYNAHRYPVWGSLARDYLAIMAASVSSEQAFSHGGITVSKRRSCLKGDIVEALQCVKCSIRHDLLFREEGPSSAWEDELEDGEDQGDDDKMDEDDEETDEQAWDQLLIEEDDDIN